MYQKMNIISFEKMFIITSCILVFRKNQTKNIFMEI